MTERYHRCDLIEFINLKLRVHTEKLPENRTRRND